MKTDIWEERPATVYFGVSRQFGKKQGLLCSTIMPAILILGPYRFFFYSNENGEPAHIHIQRERMLAKFWLQPVTLASSTRFSSKVLRKLEGLVVENKILFLEAWNEYFSS